VIIASYSGRSEVTGASGVMPMVLALMESRKQTHWGLHRPSPGNVGHLCDNLSPNAAPADAIDQTES
jgi:hypothetical protein